MKAQNVITADQVEIVNGKFRLKKDGKEKKKRSESGKRKDLGNMFFRSKWEANIARYLNFLKSHDKLWKWEYETDEFWFHKIKRGTRSYKIDFKLWDRKDSIPYYWEVKGYMDKVSETKLKRMKLYYPEIKIILIMKKEYNGIKEWAGLIPGWE